ncbi:MAG: sugar transferase [Candidatus Taylorbacteria bacterium]|nr:sugar transferase [Candidatus Taylorbacteria bacterium]
MRKFGLFLLDISALYGALAITLFIRYKDNFGYQYGVHLVPFLFIFALWLIVFYITNLYDFGFLRNNLDFYSGLFRAIIAASAISVMFFYLIPVFEITPKTNLAIFIALFAGIVTGSRTLFNKANASGFKKPLLIVGVNNQSLELAKFVETNPQLGYELKYLMDLAKEGIKNVDQIIKQEKINTVVISPETYQTPQIIDTFYRSLENKITFRNLSSFYEQMTNRVPLGAINQVWFLENLSEGGKKTYEEMKRFFDIVFSVVMGLVVLLFMPFIALAIKINSSGPVFYRQKRVGQNGKNFEIIKFRTMRADAEEKTGAVWAQENDPRITLLGRLLRKTRIDELPQIWNILKGEMSFVGPRAERPEFHEKLKEQVPFYEERYLIKPGLSGWAQINYRYSSSVADAAEKLQYDLYYIKNRSLVLDLGIILKTINIALRQAGR